MLFDDCLTFFSIFRILFSALLTFSANSSMVAFVFCNSDSRAPLLVGFAFLGLMIFLCLNALGPRFGPVVTLGELKLSLVAVNAGGDGAESLLSLGCSSSLEIGVSSRQISLNRD